MKKIIIHIRKWLKCLNEGHDYYYREYYGGGDFICKRCGKISKFASWRREE